KYGQTVGTLLGHRGRRRRGAGGRAAAGDVDVVLLNQVGVFRRQVARHRLADQLALARRQVHEAAVADHCVELGGLGLRRVAGVAIALALLVVLFLVGLGELVVLALRLALVPLAVLVARHRVPLVAWHRVPLGGHRVALARLWIAGLPLLSEGLVEGLQR